MRYISLFSGVEAATLAWEPLGWEAVAFAEIEPFPSAVLAHRWPDVPNLGDVTKVDWSKYRGAVDLVVGGSPCQAFSVAGKREGLMDERGQLMLEYVRAVAEIEPRWFLWENVPGVLSQDRGRAFGTLLREMDELGYGMAWRVLDAQFFGVAQRRRRVFLVGCARGGGGAAAAVLFEPESVPGNTQTSKQKREALATDARSRAAGSGGGVTAFAQNTRDELRIQGDGTISGALSAQPGMKQTTFVAECLPPWDVQSKRVFSENGVAPTLSSGTNEGANIQPVVMAHSKETSGGQVVYSIPSAAIGAPNSGTNAQMAVEELTPTIKADGKAHAVAQPLVMASAHYNAEIGEGGGGADAHRPHSQGRACTSNGADVFPALCATDGDKQFIDNQSVSGGRLIIQSGDSDGGRQRQDCGGRGDVRLAESGGGHRQWLPFL